MSEEAVASAEGRFRAVFDAAADAMLLADDNRRYIDVNHAAYRLLQRSRDELLGLRVEEVSPSGIDVEAMWQKFLGEGELHGEYELTRPDGSTIEVEFHATANVLPGQHLSIMRDVSDRKQAERERDESNARLRDAHDQARRIALTSRSSSCGRSPTQPARLLLSTHGGLGLGAPQANGASKGSSSGWLTWLS